MAWVEVAITEEEAIVVAQAFLEGATSEVVVMASAEVEE